MWTLDTWLYRLEAGQFDEGTLKRGKNGKGKGCGGRGERKIEINTRTGDETKVKFDLQKN